MAGFARDHLLRLQQRSAVLSAIRRFLEQGNFIEIQAPSLVTSPGMEPHLAAFEIQTDQSRRFLHTSPEYALKKLLGAGLDRIYSLGPCFRDEPPSRTHSPEFTMLEWYMTGCDLFGLMDHTERLVRAAAAGVSSVHPGVAGLALTDTPFVRMTVQDAFMEFAGLDPWTCNDSDALRRRAREQNIAVSDLEGSWDDIFFEIFLNVIEPEFARLGPLFLWGWPASQAALARLDPTDLSRALRFELYAGGLELANAFDELTDAPEQRTRFEQEQAERHALGRPVYPIDEALLQALETMNPTAGIALGVDRLMMLLTGADDIREVQGW